MTEANLVCIVNSTTVRATQRNSVSNSLHTQKENSKPNRQKINKAQDKAAEKDCIICVRADGTSKQHRQTVWAKGAEQLGVLKTIIPVQFCESGILHCNFSREVV